jgi:hypothetical protein
MKFLPVNELDLGLGIKYDMPSNIQWGLLTHETKRVFTVPVGNMTEIEVEKIIEKFKKGFSQLFTIDENVGEIFYNPMKKHKQQWLLNFLNWIVF